MNVKSKFSPDIQVYSAMTGIKTKQFECLVFTHRSTKNEWNVLKQKN